MALASLFKNLRVAQPRKPSPIEPFWWRSRAVVGLPQPVYHQLCGNVVCKPDIYVQFDHWRAARDWLENGILDPRITDGISEK